MIEGRLTARVRLRSGERRPDSNAADVRNTLADTRKCHGAIRVDIPEHINCPVWTNGESFHTAIQPVIGGAIYFRARGTAAWLQADSENVAVDLQVIKLVVPWVLGETNRIW